MLGPEQFGGWVTDREVIPGCARVMTKCAEKTCVDVSGPGLGEAGRYRMVSEPTLAVSRARTGVSAEA